MHFNYLEMKYLVFCVTLNLLFFANIVSSTVSITANYDEKTPGVRKYETKQALQLSCNVSKDTTDEKEITVKWKKGDVLVSEDPAIKSRLSLSHNGNIFKLQINNARQEDAGKYSCIAFIDGNVEATALINVESHVYVRIANKDISVVEGEKLKVICNVHGSTNVSILWTYKNTTYNESIGRVHLQNDGNITHGMFVLDDVVLEDQGELKCQAVTFANDTSDPYVGVIRVKDKYAALWPFLGICAEVLVLCAIIFIYEKKRNKTELEESDTDQSPEQKNTPDHGGKESNLRHRQ